ncbi:protein CUSTOS isoform X2 [Sorex fumeus]|uniref:protein CUSTOS isoform X2 n=1 Tax=Sorex fumeus TaxID=62283 RepID=UPI0024AD59C1|nr:protein CUSTOS isoform X2 [Sorex fumeus]
MAAPSGAMSGLESSGGGSSDSDAEELARCREAAMPAWGLEQRSTGPGRPRADPAKNQLPTTQPSLRRKVHEQDGNELQTTPEFRAHVAKKLGALLDSSITISEVAKAPAKAGPRRVPVEDSGFRLFFTSLPGDPEKKASPPRPQKRPPSSSSSEESDRELQRCREAAVSASDLLEKSAVHGPAQMEKEVKKKKKKKKKLQGPAQEAASASLDARATMDMPEKEATKLNGDQTSPRAKKKKRKKKAKQASEATPSP